MAGTLAVPFMMVQCHSYIMKTDVFVYTSVILSLNFVTMAVSPKLFLLCECIMVSIGVACFHQSIIGYLDFITIFVAVALDMCLRLFFHIAHIARTVSLSEAATVSQGISLLTAVAVRITWLNEQHEATSVFVVVALDGIVLLWISLLVIGGVISKHRQARMWCVIIVGLSGVFGWLHYVLNTNPVIWLVEYILDEEFNRLSILATWAVCIATFLSQAQSAITSLSNTATRKLFHGVAVVLFPPVAILDPQFLSLSFCIAVVLLLFLELCRVCALQPVGTLIQPFYAQFVDERESDLAGGPALILTPIYLLLGCGLPHWVAHMLEHDAAARTLFIGFSGVLVLGVGDSFAAIVGSNYGRTKWPRCVADRSVEGSAAAFFSMTAAVLLFNVVGGCILGHSVLTPMELLSRMFIPLVLCTLLEAYTTALDNLVLPIFAVGLVAAAI